MRWPMLSVSPKAGSLLTCAFRGVRRSEAPTVRALDVITKYAKSAVPALLPEVQRPYNLYGRPVLGGRVLGIPAYGALGGPLRWS